MEITPARIIEELLDPLMFSDLADEASAVSFDRIGPDSIRLDFGLHDRVFVLRVTEEHRP